MNNNFLRFLIPLLSGGTTLIGIFPTYISSRYRDSVICFSLAFSAGVMVSVSLFSLLPEAFGYLCFFSFDFCFMITFIFFLLGFLFSFILNHCFSSSRQKDSLYQVGILSIIALVMHNIPEGIMTYFTTSYHLSLGISLSLAIAFHNIPEGIAIAVPIFYSTNSRAKAFWYTFVAGFSEFFGAILAHLFLNHFLNPIVFAILLSITAGIMISLSFMELIPSSLTYGSKLLFLFGLLVGIFTMCICFFIV